MVPFSRSKRKFRLTSTVLFYLSRNKVIQSKPRFERTCRDGGLRIEYRRSTGFEGSRLGGVTRVLSQIPWMREFFTSHVGKGHEGLNDVCEKMTLAQT